MPDQTGTLFRLWAPSRTDVRLILENRPATPMRRGDDGMWQVHADGLGPGTRYRFGVNGHDFPDPASRQQEADADGWSIVRAPSGKPAHAGPLRPWHETILCEVHVGTVSPEGTFNGLRDRLEHFRDAGYTGIELMPLNAFPGRRGWGYDGTLMFAPECSYGTPEELRALVDRAHDLGLCVLLDVVYNHFGEVANFIPLYAPEWFAGDITTPWGPAIDMRQPMVRRFYQENACWWLEEYDFDGLRFDAIHEIATEARDEFLGDLARACRAVKPEAKLIVENIRNQMHWLTRNEHDKPIDFTAQWNDDFHHVMQFLVTGEKINGYEDAGRDPVADLEKSLADGFVHDGDAGAASDGRTRNEPASQLPMEAFVAFMQNHDHIGNRPDNTRMVERVDAARLDFSYFVVLLSPQLPLLFMGEEAHLRTPFMFFYDLPEPQRTQKRDNRYWQMEHVFHTRVEPGSLPDPQAIETFERSRLDWDAYGRPEHCEALARFRELVSLRRELVWPLTASKCLAAWSARQGNTIIVTWQYEAGTYNMVLNPTGEAADVEMSLHEPAASTGRFEFHNGRVRVWPWSALVWRS
ncbi:MAG: alpha-amylase family glycosyl hydrolase [Devosia sp.]